METIDFELLLQYFANLEALVPIAIFLGIFCFAVLFFGISCYSCILDLRSELSKTNKYIKRISLHDDSKKYPNGVVYIVEEDE